MPRIVAQSLSPREEAILILASRGLTDTAIALHLGISDGTVGTYWGRIRTKIGPYPRTELIAITIRSELKQQLDDLVQERDSLAARLHRAIEEESLYEEIIDAADEGILMMTKDGYVRQANDAAHRILGYEAGSLRDRPLSDLVPPAFREAHGKHFAEFCNGPQKPRPHVDASGLTADGQELPLSITMSSVNRGAELLLTCFFRPVEDHALAL